MKRSYKKSDPQPIFLMKKRIMSQQSQLYAADKPSHLKEDTLGFYFPLPSANLPCKAIHLSKYIVYLIGTLTDIFSIKWTKCITILTRINCDQKRDERIKKDCNFRGCVFQETFNQRRCRH